MSTCLQVGSCIPSWNKRHRVSPGTKTTQLHNRLRRGKETGLVMKCLPNSVPQTDKNISPNPNLRNNPNTNHAFLSLDLMVGRNERSCGGDMLQLLKTCVVHSEATFSRDVKREYFNMPPRHVAHS